MGLILLGIQNMKQKHDYCLQVARKIDTVWLMRGLQDSVYECFRYLKPLSYELKHVAKEDDEEILLGEWIRYKNQWYILGSLVQSSDAFLEIIRKHGERMKPMVRRVIAGEFSALVDLTLQLIPYENRVFKIDVPRTRVYKCVPRDEVNIEPFDVVAIGLETDESDCLQLYGDDGNSFERPIRSPAVFPELEDIMGYVVQLYRKAEDEISRIIEHNDKILKEMRRIIAPFAVAEEVHS